MDTSGQEGSAPECGVWVSSFGGQELIHLKGKEGQLDSDPTSPHVTSGETGSGAQSRSHSEMGKHPGFLPQHTVLSCWELPQNSEESATNPSGVQSKWANWS